VAKSFLGALALAAVVFVLSPSPAPAQPYQGGPYNPQNYVRVRNEVSGRVTAFEPYNLWLDRSLHVVLHHGTVINPTGITLRHGMEVVVLGHWNRDGSFEANQVDVRGERFRREPY
jgi:hypothetical protein